MLIAQAQHAGEDREFPMIVPFATPSYCRRSMYELSSAPVKSTTRRPLKKCPNGLNRSSASCRSVHPSPRSAGADPPPAPRSDAVHAPRDRQARRRTPFPVLEDTLRLGIVGSARAFTGRPPVDVILDPPRSLVVPSRCCVGRGNPSLNPPSSTLSPVDGSLRWQAE
jgi:hypothetical protein